MSDEQVTVKSVRIHHQRPAHFARSSRHWLDVMFVHCVDAWPIGRLEVLVEGLAILDNSMDLRLEELQIIEGDAPPELFSSQHYIMHCLLWKFNTECLQF